jgi:hypothetical protein
VLVATVQLLLALLAQLEVTQFFYQLHLAVVVEGLQTQQMVLMVAQVAVQIVMLRLM